MAVRSTGWFKSVSQSGSGLHVETNYNFVFNIYCDGFYNRYAKFTDNIFRFN